MKSINDERDFKVVNKGLRVLGFEKGEIGVSLECSGLLSQIQAEHSSALLHSPIILFPVTFLSPSSSITAPFLLSLPFFLSLLPLQCLWFIVGAVLHLGQMEYISGDKGAEIKDLELLDKMAKVYKFTKSLHTFRET